MSGKKIEHHTRHYLQRCINTEHWVTQNRNAFLVCEELFGKYMDLHSEEEGDDIPSEEEAAFRTLRPALGLMHDLLCAIYRDDFNPEQQNKKFDGVVRQPNMLPHFDPVVLIPLDEEEET